MNFFQRILVYNVRRMYIQYTTIKHDCCIYMQQISGLQNDSRYPSLQYASHFLIIKLGIPLPFIHKYILFQFICHEIQYIFY